MSPPHATAPPEQHPGRTKRQQASPAGATKELNSAGTFTEPVKLIKLIKLIDAAKQDVATDQEWDLLSFAKQAKNLSGGRVRSRHFPRSASDGTSGRTSTS
ncbi:hypothetical protein ACFVJ8_13145 [Streptomyces yangpuensis]|uniref:hypothetical protein n=1 Tax=Streptomyces yangpuensis TaxID=1648182 RepID=UPI00362E9606